MEKVVWLVVISTLLSALDLIGVVEGSGAFITVDPRGLYGNSHGRDWNGNNCDFASSGCDHFFHFCVREYQTSSTIDGCREAGTYRDTYAVDFNNIGPYTFSYLGAYPGRFSVFVESWDRDSYDLDGLIHDNVNDLVDRYHYDFGNVAPGESKTKQRFGSRSSYLINVKVTVSARCFDNFYASDCTIYCVNTDDNSGHYTCNQTSGDHICLEGWSRPPHCLQAVCESGCVNGICESPNMCNCNAGYTGDACDQAICLAGCQNGYCEQPGECICFEGYTGDLCEEDHRYCENNSPCLNNGTCTNAGPNTYSCECPYGYSGTDCESTYDVCSVEGFCMYGGTCTSFGVPGEFFCDCVSGSSGDRCEVLDDNCAKANCRNGGTCINLLNDFTCECVPGTTGEFCQVNIDDCRSSPCQNGGKCVDELNYYYCECPETSLDPVPDNCEGDPCDYLTCYNQGKCVAGGAGVCECEPEYTGRYCEALVKAVGSDDVPEPGLSTASRIGVGVGVGIGIPLLIIILVLLAIICCWCCRGSQICCFGNKQHVGTSEDGRGSPYAVYYEPSDGPDGAAIVKKEKMLREMEVATHDNPIYDDDKEMDEARYVDNSVASALRSLRDSYPNSGREENPYDVPRPLSGGPPRYNSLFRKPNGKQENPTLNTAAGDDTVKFISLEAEI